MKKFTMQVDIMAEAGRIRQGFGEHLSGGVMIGQRHGSSSKYTADGGLPVRVDGNEEITEPRSVLRGSYYDVEIPCNQYVTLKAVFEETENDTIIDTYVNDNLLHTRYLGGTINDFLGQFGQEFNTMGLYAEGRGIYFKNFKIISNE